MAGGVKDHVALVSGLSHLDENGPRLGPRLGILESDLAAQIACVHAAEALRHLVGLDVRPTEGLREIGGFDDQRVAFPVAARIAQIELEAGGSMRTPVHEDGAIASAGVIVLHVNRHRFWRLHDLHYRALSKSSVQWKKRHRDAETTRRLRDELGIVVAAASSSQARE